VVAAMATFMQRSVLTSKQDSARMLLDSNGLI
jgi:hypothetical protein